MAFKAENLRLDPDQRRAIYMADTDGDTLAVIRRGSYWKPLEDAADSVTTANRQDQIAYEALKAMAQREAELSLTSDPNSRYAGVPIHIVAGGGVTTPQNVRQAVGLIYWDSGRRVGTNVDPQLRIRPASADVK